MFQKLPKMLQNSGDFLFSCLWRDLAKSLVTQKKFNALIIRNCQSFWCYLYSSVHYSCVYKTVLCNAHLSNTQLCTILKCAKPRYLQYLYVQYSVACNIRLCSTQLNAILSSVFEFITAGNRGCPRHNLRPPLDDGCIEPSDFSCHWPWWWWGWYGNYIQQAVTSTSMVSSWAQHQQINFTLVATCIKSQQKIAPGALQQLDNCF